MDDCGASLLHIPLKSKQGTLYTREGRGNKGERKKGREAEKKKKKEEAKREGCRSNGRAVAQGGGSTACGAKLNMK